MLRPLFLALWLFTTAACQSDAPAPATVRQGEFRVLLPSRPSTLNPDLDIDEAALVVGRNLFNHLVTVDDNDHLLPDLAREWSVSPDGLTYTFPLRDGIRWHDGTPFSSEDVRWTYEHIAKDGVARAAMQPIESVSTPDRSTVAIRLKHVWAPFVADLAQLGTAILPKHVYGDADWRSNPANDRPIGTGPFKFSGWSSDGRTLTLDANGQYFRPGPYVQRIRFSVVKDPEAAFRLLQEDGADYSLLRPPQAAVPQLERDPRMRVHFLASAARVYLAINHRRRPFDDVRVRRALATAIDRVALVEQVLLGHGVPAMGWYTPAVEWAYNPNARVPEFSIEEARSLLEDAGYGGRRLRPTIVIADASPIRELGEAIVGQLRAIGIVPTVAVLPSGDVPKRVLRARDFDLALVAGSQGPDPDALRRRFAATGDEDYVGYDNPELREVLEQGARTMDLAARAKAYFRAQEILAREVPFIPLTEGVRLAVYNARVRGLPQIEAQGLVGSLDFSLVRVDTRPGAGGAASGGPR